MPGISVGQIARDFLAAVDDFKKRDFPRAISMALNRTADGARVDASREIRKRYRVKVATVNKSFSIQKATPTNLAALVSIRGRPLSLGGFDPHQTRQGVSVNVKGTRKLIRHAFVRRLRTNKGDEYDVVFVRQGKARYPLKALKTIDIPGLFVLEEVNLPVRMQAYSRFEKELHSAVRAILSRS